LTSSSCCRKNGFFGGRAEAILEKPSKNSIENAKILRDKVFKIIFSSKNYFLNYFTKTNRRICEVIFTVKFDICFTKLERSFPFGKCLQNAEMLNLTFKLKINAEILTAHARRCRQETTAPIFAPIFSLQIKRRATLITRLFTFYFLLFTFYFSTPNGLSYI
jgi:hypothetical protein